jgi:hypothetical protein
MRTKSFILGGVAIAGLIGAAPALAFTHHPGTPAEHRQTEDLNQQQLNQAQAQPGTSAQSASATTGAPTDQQANAAPTDQQASAAPSAAPTGAVTQSGASSKPVDALANSPQALANASVEASSGQAVGAVQWVIMDASGKAKTVIVALLGNVNKLVAIAANELSFDESRNVVVAQMSADQIKSLPAAPQG